MDFFIDGQIYSFYPDQPEAKLLTLMMLKKNSVNYKKNHGLKNPTTGCDLGSKYSGLRLVTFQKKNDLAVQYEDIHD